MIIIQNIKICIIVVVCTNVRVCYILQYYTGSSHTVYVVLLIERQMLVYYKQLLSLLNEQDYTATIFLRQRWTDERLLFEGNKSLSLDGRLVELLWVPDTFIVDSKKSFLHDITVENRLIRIFPNGTVLYALR